MKAKSTTHLFNLLIIGLLFLINNTGFASVIAIHGNTIIDKPTSFNNVTIDMSEGRFTLKKGATLEIKNSTINATISTDNPFAILVTNGNLILQNNKFNVKTSNITPLPKLPALYSLLAVIQGEATITENSFTIDSSVYSSLMSTLGIPTDKFNFSKNRSERISWWSLFIKFRSCRSE